MRCSPVVVLHVVHGAKSLERLFCLGDCKYHCALVRLCVCAFVCVRACVLRVAVHECWHVCARACGCCSIECRIVQSLPACVDCAWFAWIASQCGASVKQPARRERSEERREECLSEHGTADYGRSQTALEGRGVATRHEQRGTYEPPLAFHLRFVRCSVPGSLRRANF